MPAGMKKTVRFSDEVTVARIAPRNSEQQWWNANQYMNFRSSAAVEIKTFQVNYPRADKKTASHLLYNPAGTLFDGFRVKSLSSTYIYDFLSRQLVPTVKTFFAMSYIRNDVFNGFTNMKRMIGHLQVGVLLGANGLFLSPICFKR
mmetsp:Transcript_2501/g.3904  ORF Transcript_2501/g.3904 Transcript_2501/m.3904 type:complete len:146 (-) Transcript_2501:327-764(-)